MGSTATKVSPSSKLPNYIRAHRKRASLTQAEVAFLLGSKSSARISRHERFKEMPELPTVLAYEILFQTPVRNLFRGTHQTVEQRLKNRIRLLIRKLTRAEPGHAAVRKIELLRGLLTVELPSSTT